MKQILIVDEFPMNLNTYRNAHHYKKNKEKVYFEAKVRQWVMEQDIKPMVSADVTFTFFFSRNVRRDLDNYAACAKPILDGLVKCGILEDDNVNYIKKFHVEYGGLMKDNQHIKIELKGELK